MDEIGISNSLTPPPEVHDVPAKRLKLDKIDSSNLNPSRASEWEKICLMRELTACRTRLSNTEATAAELREMKTEIAEAFAEREEMLEIQGKVERDTIRHLEMRLEAAKRSSQPQEMVQGEMSSVKSKMREKIELLFTKKTEINEDVIPSTSRETPTCPKPQQNELNIQNQREESLDIKIEQIFAGNIRSKESNPQRAESTQVDIQIQEPKLVSPATIVFKEDVTLLLSRANVLEDQLQSAKNMISTLRDAVKNQPVFNKTVPIVGKELKSEEGVEGMKVNGPLSAASKHETLSLQQGGDSLDKRVGEKRSQVHNQGKEQGTAHQIHEALKKTKEDTMKKNTEEVVSQAIKDESSSHAIEKKSPSSNQSHNDHGGKPEAEGCEQNRRLNVANRYVLVSNTKFFEIDWNKYYKKIRRNKFACKKCPEVRCSKPSIEDHVWVQHCGGTFKCPYCLNRSLSLIYRYSILKHVKIFHPNECSSKK